MGIELQNLIKNWGGLEKQRKLLENDVAKKYNIPLDQITRTSCIPTIFRPDISDMIKLWKAKEQGYIEAKKLYEEKIQKLQDDLYRCKKKGNSEKELLQNTILQILDEICKEEMRIAELRILLKE